MREFFLVLHHENLIEFLEPVKAQKLPKDYSLDEFLTLTLVHTQPLEIH